MLDFGYYNMDCNQGMKQFPDKYFDLAIVDPPYGINIGKMNLGAGGGLYWQSKNDRTFKFGNWDIDKPKKNYFNYLFKISKNQIIWGGNYFIEFLYSSPGWIFWDKNKGDTDFADGELAWSSFNKSLKKIKYTWSGFIQNNMKNKEIKIHPTQKPIALYRWLLQTTPIQAMPLSILMSGQRVHWSLARWKALNMWDLKTTRTIITIQQSG